MQNFQKPQKAKQLAYCLFKIFGEKPEEWQNTDEIPCGEAKNVASDNETDDDIVLEDKTTLLDAEDENPAYDLPKHWRCAAHTINLVASVDSQKAFYDADYKKANRSAFGKAVALWNKQHKVLIII